MKPICAICGRRTTPFVMMGSEPIGPKCAAKAGLTPRKTPKGSRLQFLKLKRSKPDNVPTTGDLFEGIE